MSRNHDFSARVQENTRRILQLIDAIAAYQEPLPLGEIRQRLIDQTGVDWNRQTLLRDLRMLQELGFVERVSVTPHDSRWLLRPRESERLQCAACVLVDDAEPIRAHIVKYQDRGCRPVYHREAMTATMAYSMAATLRSAGMRASVEVVRIRHAAAAG